ncbi:hypothetical protein GCM10010244_20610 [Streptomyces coeruleorubidus]|nr:hypothetical protein GCM10010244_20610 [Streptomyces bellus]
MRESKYENACVSSRTVMVPRSLRTSSAASAKHRSVRAASMWKNRSPGVAGAWCRGPASSRNGCSRAGRGPPNSRSQARDPIPATQPAVLAGEAYGPHQAREGPQRLPYDGFPAGVDRGYEEHRDRRRRVQHRLRQRLSRGQR